MYEDAYAETTDNCVSYQLARHIKMKGQAAFTQEEVAAELLEITQRIYEENPGNNPYGGDGSIQDIGEVPTNCSRIGFTAAAIMC